MQSRSDDNRRELVDWFKANGLLTITLIGLFLYAAFSIPATIFYSRLGTSPGEVGTTYASLLSGSTLGAVCVLAAVIILISYLALMVIQGTVFWLAFRTGKFAWKHRRVFFKDTRELSDEQFESKLAILKFMYLSAKSAEDPDWEHMETIIRRIRGFEQLDVRTPADSAEYERLVHLWNRGTPNPVKIIRFRKVLGSPRRNIVILIIVVIALPVVAFFQAGDVLAGKNFPGSQLGVFDYNAKLVDIRPAAPDVTQAIKGLVGQQVFFLGQNSECVVLYAPKSRSTIRIPIAEVVVTGRP